MFILFHSIVWIQVSDLHHIPSHPLAFFIDYSVDNGFLQFFFSFFIIENFLFLSSFFKAFFFLDVYFELTVFFTQYFFFCLQKL